MILGIIQVRMGSTRFPGKALAKVAGHRLIDLVVERCRRSNLVDRWVIATTTNKEDDVFQGAFRGPEQDVLARFYMCAVSHKLEPGDIVVRITADDPLKDPALIDECCAHMLSEPLEYCSNTLEPTYPYGCDVEAIRFKTLKWLHENCTQDHWREHVTYYITEHPEEFKVHNFKFRENIHKWRWSIDTKEDLKSIEHMLSTFHIEDGKPLDPVTVSFEDLYFFIANYQQELVDEKGKINKDFGKGPKRAKANR